MLVTFVGKNRLYINLRYCFRRRSVESRKEDPDNSAPQAPNGDGLSNLGAVILCGGKGSRLGMDKTQLLFKNQTFLERVVDQVSQVCSPIVLVGDTDFGYHKLPKSILFDSDHQTNKGPLEGIRVGLERLSTTVEFAFVTSCDVPLLRPELIRYLFENLNQHDAIIPVSDSRVFGMTAIYRTSLHEQLGERITSNQLRVSEIAGAVNSAQPNVETLRKIDPNLDSMTNVNSAQDYFNLLSRFGLDTPKEIANRLL